MVDKSWKKDHIKIREIAKDFISVSRDFRAKVDSGEIDLDKIGSGAIDLVEIECVVIDLDKIDIENENKNENRMEWNENENPILIKKRAGINPEVFKIMDQEKVSRATAYKRLKQRTSSTTTK